MSGLDKRVLIHTVVLNTDACETAAWPHGKVLRTEKTLVRDDFRKQRCEDAVKNSQELLMVLWNERRPECAHQLTGETEGWKMASARAPTRDCTAVLLETNGSTLAPTRLLPCWRGAVHSSQNDHEHLANYGGLVREFALHLDCDKNGTLPRETRQQSAT